MSTSFAGGERVTTTSGFCIARHSMTEAFEQVRDVSRLPVYVCDVNNIGSV